MKRIWFPEIVLAALLCAVFAVLIAFMAAHGRFPSGSGEALNWLLGLTP